MGDSHIQVANTDYLKITVKFMRGENYEQTTALGKYLRNERTD